MSFEFETGSFPLSSFLRPSGSSVEANPSTESANGKWRRITPEDLKARATKLETELKTAHNRKMIMFVSTVAVVALGILAAVALAVLITSPPAVLAGLGAAIVLSPLTPYLVPVIGGVFTATAMILSEAVKHYAKQEKALKFQKNISQEGSFKKWACENTNPDKLEHVEFYRIYVYTQTVVHLEEDLNDSGVEEDLNDSEAGFVEIQGNIDKINNKLAKQQRKLDNKLLANQ